MMTFEAYRTVCGVEYFLGFIDAKSRSEAEEIAYDRWGICVRLLRV